MTEIDLVDSTEPVTPDESPAAVALLVMRHDGSTASYALSDGGSLSIGRAVDADIRIDDPSASRNHAILHDSGDGWLVTDLSSANGTQVGPRQLRGDSARARVWEAIQIGRTVLILCAAGESRDHALLPEGLRGVHELIDLIAPLRTSVVLLGETGVGKDRLAERIHRGSAVASGPLIRVNCAELVPSALPESQLFGHTKGAFTGAISDHRGLLEQASNGTLFFDEIGEMTLDMQAKLLLVLERREFRRLGGTRLIPLTARLVFATHRDLEVAVAERTFREDLYHRVSEFPIHVPPLRYRLEELDGLVHEFVEQAAREAGTEVPRVALEALAQLRAHRWPGNIRELRNLVRRATLLARGRDVSVSVLERAGFSVEPTLGSRVTEPAQRREVAFEDDERGQVLAALAKFQGNQTRAAEHLKIARNTLIKRMRQHGIPGPRPNPTSRRRDD